MNLTRRDLFKSALLTGVAATRAYSFLTNNPLAGTWDPLAFADTSAIFGDGSDGDLYILDQDVEFTRAMNFANIYILGAGRPRGMHWVRCSGVIDMTGGSSPGTQPQPAELRD